MITRERRRVRAGVGALLVGSRLGNPLCFSREWALISLLTASYMEREEEGD